MPSLTRKLRPAKVAGALRRRWFERRLERLPLSPVTGLVDLGTLYGGWTIPGDIVDSSWTCYCVGVGADISFDLELIRRYGVRVRAFDAVAEYVRGAQEAAADEPQFSARQVAIAASDGPVRMQRTHDPTSQSVSAAGLYESSDYVEVPGRTLPSLAHELGDERIDLLKLDIEGAEYEVMPRLDLRALGVRVFCTQLHHNKPVNSAHELIDGLRAQGFRAVAIRPTIKLTFVRDGELSGA
jgi:FkbM family methyltransferase